MYLYSLHGYEYNIVLTHNERFTDDEFIAMCNEAPRMELYNNKFYYDETEIESLLVSEYGFMSVEYQASLFTDQEVKSNISIN